MSLLVDKSEFPAASQITYLNTGTTGLIPKSVRGKYVDNLRFVYESGPIRPDVVEWLHGQYDEVRSKAALFVGAKEKEIALVSNTSEGLYVPLLGFPWKPGDEVVTTDIEHPALTVPLELVKERFGVRVKVAVSVNGMVTADALKAVTTKNTRMICISHVSYLSGARLPLREICHFARENGIITCIDGAQSVGAFAVDMGEVGADFYSFPGYKWTLGLPGTAFLYVRSGLEDRIAPYRLGYRSFLEGELREGAHRYELATMPHLEFIAAGLAMDYLSAQGMRQVEERIAALSQMLKEGLSDLRYVEVVTPRAAEDSAGLVTFVVKGLAITPKEILDSLAEKKVIIRDLPWRSALRVSPHIYNDKGDIEKLLSTLESILS